MLILVKQVARTSKIQMWAINVMETELAKVIAMYHVGFDLFSLRMF